MCVCLLCKCIEVCTCLSERVHLCVFVCGGVHGFSCVGVCMHRMAGVWGFCRILDGIGTLPKDGWRNWFFSAHIVKNTYIPPRNQVCTSFQFLACGRRQKRIAEKKKIEFLISLTSPCCCCSARSGQHSSDDECLISRNTSQIAKLYLPWIAKCLLFCSVLRKQSWTMGLFCLPTVFSGQLWKQNNVGPESFVGSQQIVPFQIREKVGIYLECPVKGRGMVLVVILWQGLFK